MKIIIIIGARPQFIKAAAVSRVFKKNKDIFEQIIIHTGQHFDSNMSDVFFSELDIPKPNYNLGIGGGSHGQNTGRMLEEIESILMKEKPDWVLVFGDTDSTLAGALAAAKLHIQVVHVEAGLRSFNSNMPEELNRILTDNLSSLLLTPTEIATKNLIREGFDANKIIQIGDVMYDAALYYKENSTQPVWFSDFNLKPNQYILSTVHRAENRNNLKSILKGLGDTKLPTVLPLHPNTRKIIKQLEINVPDNLFVVEPVGYLEMVWLEMNCMLIVTDSGGIQKEAYFHKKPCVTMRNETEWLELVELGYNQLTGSNSAAIYKAIMNLSPIDINEGLYGDGNSSSLIVKALCGETNIVYI